MSSRSSILHLLIALFIICYAQNVSSNQFLDNFERKFFNEFDKLQTRGVRSDELVGLIKSGNNQENGFNRKCLMCRGAVFTVLEYFRLNYTVPQLKDMSVTMCTLFIGSGSVHICTGYVNSFAPHFEYMVHNRPNLTSEYVCAIFEQESNCGPRFEPNKILVDIDPNGKCLLTSKTLTRTESPELTIVQVTDPHYDPNYLAGGNAKCEYGACCNKWQGLPKQAADSAGFWGDYNRCDSPKRVVNDTFYQIQKQHSHIDYIYFTGDIVDHFTYATSVEGNSNAFSAVFEMFDSVFPSVPVYPVLGNHESHPANLYPPSYAPAEFRVDWLYKLAFKEWSRWIPEQDLQTVLLGGYYTTLVRPGLRIVALNSNVGYLENYWLIFDDEYFIPQLQWLHDVLLKAEKDGEKVHILSHVPSNVELYHKFSYNFQLIIERFSKTISAHFNGHTHADEFNINFASYNKAIAVSVGWNGGSATSFIDVNPNYSVYEVDGGSYEVLDFTTWIYNLTEANLGGGDRPPRWYKEYSFKEEFGVVDLSPSSLKELIEYFLGDKQLLLKYWQLKMKNGDPFLKKGCDDNCLRRHLCHIVRNDFHVHDFCKTLS